MEIFVESMATIISMMKGMAIRRVASPAINSKPPTISNQPTKPAVNWGNGIPSFVNLPTPWFA